MTPTISKYFIQLTHKQWVQVENLLSASVVTGDKEYNKVMRIIEKAPQSSISPLPDDKVVNALLFNGNVLMDLL